MLVYKCFHGRLRAGTIGAEVHLPFDGTRGTGSGHREAGTAALDFCTGWKSIHVDFSGKLQRARIDNRWEADPLENSD
jgi:aldehyde dehydrogenase (NAD+)